MTEIEMMRPLTHVGTQTIVTARLVLRAFRMEDAADMYAWASNPEVVRFLSYKPHTSLEQTKAFLQTWVEHYASKEVYNWAIEYNGVVIGNISVVESDNECFQCHLGWQIDRPYWNKGIMTEAADAVVGFLFEKVGYDRISSGCDARNTGSARVMEKIGMRHEGTLRRYCYQKDGTIGDKKLYAILREDWNK